MATILTFQGASGGVVSIEISPEGEGISKGGSLRDALRVIREIGNSFVDELDRGPEKKSPSEFEISFGLKGLPSGEFAVSASASQANFFINLKWNNTNPKKSLGFERIPKEKPQQL